VSKIEWLCRCTKKERLWTKKERLWTKKEQLCKIKSVCLKISPADSEKISHGCLQTDFKSSLFSHHVRVMPRGPRPTYILFFPVFFHFIPRCSFFFLSFFVTRLYFQVFLFSFFKFKLYWYLLEGGVCFARPVLGLVVKKLCMLLRVVTSVNEERFIVCRSIDWSGQ
jgi:hypothetical protein